MIQHRILKEQSCIYIEVRQSPKLADFISASKLLVRDPAYKAELNRVCDLSQANLAHVTIPQMVEFVDYARENIPMGSTARAAIVAPDMARSGIFRTLGELTERNTIRIFTDPMLARKWAMERPHYRREDGSFCKVLGGVV